MPQIPIIMPQLGESIAEATIVHIAVQVGDQVENGQDVIEVETNKAVMSVTTPCPGKVASLCVETGQSYPVGSVLGWAPRRSTLEAMIGSAWAWRQRYPDGYRD